jgi:hypothetical protein
MLHGLGFLGQADLDSSRDVKKQELDRVGRKEAAQSAAGVSHGVPHAHNIALVVKAPRSGCPIRFCQEECLI